MVKAEGEANIARDAWESLENERSGIDERMKKLWRDAAGDSVFGEASDEGVDLRSRAEFSRSEKIRGQFGVEGLLLVEASFAFGVKDAEVLVILATRHTARAAVCKRELTTRRQRRFGFHGMT